MFQYRQSSSGYVDELLNISAENGVVNDSTSVTTDSISSSSNKKVYPLIVVEGLDGTGKFSLR